MLFIILFFSSLSYADCDCRSIKEGLSWEDFNCIKSCKFEEDFSKRQALLLNQCLDKKNIKKSLDKKKVNLLELRFVLAKITNQFENFETAQEQILKQKCPKCHFVSQTYTKVRFNSKKRIASCPLDRIKSKKYSVSFKEEITNNKLCRESLNKKFQSYVNGIVLGKSSEGKKLWKECPVGCSFQTSSKSRINTESCRGYLDLVVYCDHRVKKLYNIQSQYKAYLQCTELI